MKEPQLILPTFTMPQILLPIDWKPKGFMSIGCIC
jgi:hypothetical protein